ncbi:MAG: D-alanyl-D-alanine carboxypeptidase/D-alanyl-D-alanine-endopeptidase [Sulfuricellaceae bacterium]|nr:D-alanyl-D-alanine carboxypeptidase/D-alanyl-D-alanine-endopeptidase [Sulfuricellaceae bacterium]
MRFRVYASLVSLCRSAFRPTCRPEGRPTLLRASAVFVLFFLTLPGLAETLPDHVRMEAKAAGIPESSVGIWVQEANSNTPVLALGADRAMNPASVMKLVTTYVGLESLGAAYVWQTEIYRRGAMQQDRLEGDLILKGMGDPKLTLENFWRLLRDLRQRGIREIQGDVIIDQSFFEPPSNGSAVIDSEPNRAYNTAPQALLVNFNAIRIRLLPQADGSLQVAADPALPNFRLLDKIVSGNGACGDWREGILTRMTSERVLTLSGNFSRSCGEKNFNLNLMSNGVYLDGIFRQLWGELGGTLQGGVREGRIPDDAVLLTRFDSPPLAEVIRDINKFSNNVMARQLFLTLGSGSEGAPGNQDKARRAVKRWLTEQRLDFPELVLENGSGLSRLERISPRHMGNLLAAASHSPLFSEFESTLPIVAVDGTMKKRLNGQTVAGRAHIKTGYLEGVRSIAGYVVDAKGRRMVVVAMVNHPKAINARGTLDALLEWVYQRP